MATAIREQILRGEVRHGELLRLAPLAEQLDMSMTPVREALLQLAQDGWVSHEPNRGFRVVPIRRDNVIDTYFMWATAEGELAARAALQISKEAIASLREADAKIRALEDHGTQLALDLNSKLHSQIHALVDAPKLLWFADLARRLVPLQFDSTFHSIPGWAEINRFGHSAIIDALEAGDEALSRELMKSHFLQTCDVLIEWLDNMSFWMPAGGDEAA